MIENSLNRLAELDPVEVTSDGVYWHDDIPEELLNYAPAFPDTPVTYDVPALYSPYNTLSP